MLMQRKAQMLEEKKLRDLKIQQAEQQLDPFFSFNEAKRTRVIPPETTYSEFLAMDNRNLNSLTAGQKEYVQMQQIRKGIEEGTHTEQDLRDFVNVVGGSGIWKDMGPYFENTITGERRITNLGPEQQPEYKSEVEAAKVRGKYEGGKQTTAGSTIKSSENLIDWIDMASNHPGREAATGFSSLANIAPIPGSARKDFLVLEGQLKGNAFLQAYQQLKGGGPITDREGAIATQAQNRLENAQSEEAYLEALDEMERDIKMLLEEAKSYQQQTTDDGWKIERVN
jgi:hypothetical protein